MDNADPKDEIVLSIVLPFLSLILAYGRHEFREVYTSFYVKYHCFFCHDLLIFLVGGFLCVEV